MSPRALLLLLLAAPPAPAQVLSDYVHEADRIHPVRTALGITTQIDLGPDNPILDYGTGFGSGWDIRQRDHVLYLKPLAPDADTNLFIRTARHTHLFELRVVASDWTTLEQAKAEGVQYRIALRVAETRTPPPALPEGAPSTALVPGRAYHFDYAAKAFRRHRWMLPTHVHDDGRFTYLHIGGIPGMPGGFPAVFAREGESASDFVVNSSVDGRVIIVHGVYPYLVLRHGEQAVLLRRVPPGGDR